MMNWAKDSTPLDGLFPQQIPGAEEDARSPTDELSPGGRRRVYGALCLAARAAGRRTPARLRLLADYRRRLGIAPDDAELLETLADHARAIRMGSRLREKELTIEALLDLVTVDGQTTRRERELLQRIAAKAGLSAGEIDARVAQALARRRPAPRPVVSPRFAESDLAALFGPEAPKAPAAARSSARAPRFSESDSGRIFDESLLGAPAPRAVAQHLAERSSAAGMFGASDVGAAAEAGTADLDSDTGFVPAEDEDSDTGFVPADEDSDTGFDDEDSDTGAVPDGGATGPELVASEELCASAETRAALLSSFRLLAEDGERFSA